nr:hypothetical protein [Borreliella turdi]WKC77516.1 hypothetical protein QIA31_00075 [Borreliella turdi]
MHRVDRHFPLSKLCDGGGCRIKNTALKLSDTRWTYSNFNTLHDRYVNTALNFKAFYFK